MPSCQVGKKYTYAYQPAKVIINTICCLSSNNDLAVCINRRKLRCGDSVQVPTLKGVVGLLFRSLPSRLLWGFCSGPYPQGCCGASVQVPTQKDVNIARQVLVLFLFFPCGVGSRVDSCVPAMLQTTTLDILS